MIANLPRKFVRLMNECHGAAGEEWLNNLPRIIAEIESNWSLQIQQPFHNLSYHFVAPCRLKNHSEAVLKIGFPENNSPIFNEAEMLKLYDGNGAAKILRLDENRSALLLERLKPGENLKEIIRGNENKTVEIAVEALQKIVRTPPVKHNFVFLDEWFANFRTAKDTVFPAQHFEKAWQFYEKLSKAESFLIHGDFHHENILSAARESFSVIDPKGVVGQIGYEISVFLNNHVWNLANDKDLKKHLDFAVEKFSEAFGISTTDLRCWAYTQAVLSAWWTFEENGENWQNDLALADVWEV